MNYEDLTPEQQEKARACKTSDELRGLALENGIELSDEQIDKISGGWKDGCSYSEPTECPICGGTDFYEIDKNTGYTKKTVCRKCGNMW